MSAAPALSVLMAAYNGAALIGATLATLRAQSFTDFEVVIVDDCSTDATLETIRAFDDPRIVLIESSENQGPVRARNRGFEAVRGRYVAALDQDDLCHPDRFARQVAFLDANPDCVLVGTAASILQDNVLSPSRQPAHTSRDFLDWQLLVRNPFIWSSVMFRTDAARQLTPFTRPEMLYVEDFDLYHRLRRHGRVARIDAELLTYRSHPGGASKRYRDTMIGNVPHVLEAPYEAIFGDSALADATRVARYVMAGLPVTDAGELARVATILDTLRGWFLDTHDVDAQTRAMVDADHDRLASAVERCAVRAGSVRLRDAIRARTDGATGASRDLRVSAMVGRARALRRRIGGSGKDAA